MNLDTLDCLKDLKRGIMMTDLHIIGTPHSNFTWTCRIVCVEKGVPYTFDQVRPHTPEVESISPFGLIPVMRCSTNRLAYGITWINISSGRVFETRHLHRTMRPVPRITRGGAPKISN